MTFQTGGNVGIGTTAPGNVLELYKSQGAATAININNPDATHDLAFSGVQFYQGGTLRGGIYSVNDANTSGAGGPKALQIWNFSNGPLILATNNGEKVRVDTSGNVGIGVTGPSEALEVNGNVKATSFISTSDRRLKTDIQSVKGLDAVLQLNGVQWAWRGNGERDAGVIAQDVEKVFPDAVRTDPQTGYKGVKYQYLFAPLIESTKELYGMCKANEEQMALIQRQIASVRENDARQDRDISSLLSDNEKLKAENAELKKRLGEIEKRLGIK